MEGKFEAPKAVPIRKRREALDKAPAEAVRTEEFPKEKHAVKHEAYAIASFLIERYHQKTKEVLQDESLEILTSLKGAFVINEEVARALVLDEHGQVTFDREVLWGIDDDTLEKVLMSEMVFPKIYMRAFDRAFVQKRNEFDEKEKAIYQRLGDLFHKSQARIVVRENSVRAQSVEGFISAGVATAATESWNILLALTRKYNQEFHTPLTDEVLDALTSDIKKILNQTASLHIADFTYLRDLSVESLQLNLNQVAWDKILVFTEEGSGLRVSIRDEYKHLDEQERERRECTVGCPGRDAIVTNDEGKKVNVVGDVFDFHKELAKRVVLPNQGVLL
ncbi:MAG: hypothetical protein KIH67_002860 [Candidatus Moranbacteria bacterium]|nr:hypothetical protein [Candidatus Moranbacteria bacterium]